MDPEITDLAFRPALLGAGVTDDEVRRLVRRRELATLRPGVYVPADDERLDTPAARHALAVRAAVPKVAPDAVVRHVSAAVLHGLPLWNVRLDRVHVTRHRRSGGRRTRLLHVHAAALEPDEIDVVHGVAVTSIARTLVDLARTLPFESALVPADAALQHRRVTTVELAAAVERSAGRRGNTAARRVVAFARPGAESPGETRSRVAIDRAGLPVPVLQHVIEPLGARVDFWWEEYLTVGEFDGRVKYGRLLRPGQDPGDVVFAEKRREDALRDLGCKVVRWINDELALFGPVADRLRRAFARR